MDACSDSGKLSRITFRSVWIWRRAVSERFELAGAEFWKQASICIDWYARFGSLIPQG